MRTRTFARGAAVIFDTEIALRRLRDGFHFLIHEKFAALVACLNHANGIVGTIRKTGFAADARRGIYDHLSGKRLAVNGTGRTANHADRISAMHAGIGDHQTSGARPMTQKPRIIVVR